MHGSAAFVRSAKRAADHVEPRIVARQHQRQVVADETAGQSVALLFLPWRDVGVANGWTWNLTLAAIAFATFRLFDVTKPPPINGIQRFRSGWGILLDDLVAGLFALGVAQVVGRLVLPMVVGP